MLLLYCVENYAVFTSDNSTKASHFSTADVQCTHKMYEAIDSRKHDVISLKRQYDEKDRLSLSNFNKRSFENALSRRFQL